MIDIVSILALGAVTITWMILHRPRSHAACREETARAVQAVRIAQSDERAERINARLGRLEQIAAEHRQTVT